jgi:glycosyltransferase involved in cell wall biosynthesis
MHILLLHQLLLRTDEAGMTQHFEFARHLVGSGHRITILAGTRSYLTGAERGPERAREAGLEIVSCGVWGQTHRSFAQRTLGFLSFMFTSFWRGLGLRDVDLVWSTSPPLPQVVTAWALAALKRAPLVFEVRDLWPDVAVQLGVLRNPILIAIARLAERFLYRCARRVVVNSPGFIPHLLRAAVPPERLALVPNGTDTSRFLPADKGEAFRSAHGLEGKFVVLYAGAHGLSNDLTTLLAAADLLRGESRIVVVLLGDGKEKSALVAAAQRMGLTNVRFLPPVTKDEIPSALAASDCGVAILRPIPLFATTFPNKVFDYMAAGRPVLLAIDGVIRQVVEEAGAGLAVPPGEPYTLSRAILAMAADPAEARRMGMRGREFVTASFDRANLASQMERVLREAAAR